MNRKFKLRGAVTAVRHHPVRAAAICVPLLAASVLTGQSMASATPTPTLAVSQAALNAAPAPHVLVADNNMSSQVVKVKPANICCFRLIAAVLDRDTIRTEKFV